MTHFEVTILADGTIKLDSGSVDGPEHLNAERLLTWLAQQTGGPTTRVRRAHTHEHEHAHTHEHEHQGHKH